MRTYRLLVHIFSSCCLLVLLSACIPFSSGGTGPTPTTASGTTASSTGHTPTVSSSTLAPTGGSLRVIYSIPTSVITTIRAISRTTLLIIIFNATGDTTQNGLWKIQTDGSGLTPLTTHGGYLNQFTQNTWSNVSRDGRLYALRSNQGVLIGPLNGGPPSTIASFNGNGDVNVVGWTFI